MWVQLDHWENQQPGRPSRLVDDDVPFARSAAAGLPLRGDDGAEVDRAWMVGISGCSPTATSTRRFRWRRPTIPVLLVMTGRGRMAQDPELWQVPRVPQGAPTLTV